MKVRQLTSSLSIGAGYGVQEKSHLQRVNKAFEPEFTEVLKIPTSSVNTCISINSLKKASERSLESSFRREFGLSMRSDVDELKEELAALKQRLANEEAEAQKLRDEVQCHILLLESLALGPGACNESPLLLRCLLLRIPLYLTFAR